MSRRLRALARPRLFGWAPCTARPGLCLPARRARADGFNPEGLGQRVFLVSAITWSKRIKPGSAANPWTTDPGVYCLRTTLVEQDNATLWRTYTMLTNLESVFRSLKTDLGLRPVFHRVDRRVDGHLFISVLAYHFVHMLRLKLKAKGIDDSWQTLRDTLATQHRVTVTMQRATGVRCTCARPAGPSRSSKRSTRSWGMRPTPVGPIARSSRATSSSVQALHRAT